MHTDVTQIPERPPIGPPMAPLVGQQRLNLCIFPELLEMFGSTAGKMTNRLETDFESGVLRRFPGDISDASDTGAAWRVRGEVNDFNYVDTTRRLQEEIVQCDDSTAPKRTRDKLNDDRFEDFSSKERYYRLDHNLNELVERTANLASPWRIDEELSQDIHACVDCGKQYSTSSNLARHRQTHRIPGRSGSVDHSEGMRGPLLGAAVVLGETDHRKARKCPHCDKSYVSMPAYSMHVRTHNQGCACPHCGKRFSRPWLLQGHVRTHTGEKPFSCSVCGKHFADKSNLRAHVQTHSPEKPFVCGRCGKAFALKSYLYKHEESSCMRSFSGLGLLQQRNQ